MKSDDLKMTKVCSKTKHSKTEIPSTMDTFLGRSNLIIFCAPNPDMEHSKKYINVRYLIKQAETMLKTGLETPIFAETSLEKLAYGLHRNRGSGNNDYQTERTKFITKVGRDEVMMFWQSDMLKVARWFTHFDEFQMLPFQIRIQILKGIWRVWSRLDRLVSTMIGRRDNTCEDNMMMINLKERSIVFDLKNTEVDLSWQSKYNAEQLKLFGYTYLDEKSEQLIQDLLNLELTDVELAYMMCQLCFYYVGKRFQGVILEVSERLLEVLSNNLHDYYTRENICQKYSVRIASMMRINNQIQNGITKRRAKAELMRIFDVFFIEFSDPEMFVDA